MCVSVPSHIFKFAYEFFENKRFTEEKIMELPTSSLIRIRSKS